MSDPTHDQHTSVPSSHEEALHRSAKYYAVHRRRGWLRSAVLWGTWLLIALVASTAYGAWAFIDETINHVTNSNSAAVQKFRKVAAPLEPGKPATILLLGSDTRNTEGELGNSDTMIMVRVDTHQGFISMLSFPRDSWVEIPGYGTGKLNSAFSLGEGRERGGGPALVAETLTKLTGQEINYYANIDFAGFVKIVNDLGGVYIDVDRRYINDNSGPVKYEMIDLKPGYQLLNGDDSLDFVRHRYTDNDFARMARQQMFLSELKRKVRSDLGNVIKVPFLIRSINKNAETTLEGDRLLQLLRFAVELPDDRVYRRTLTGPTSMMNEQSIVELQQTEIADGVNDWLQPPLPEVKRANVDPSQVDVRVLNGSGKGLAAERMASLLRARGYNARALGNAQSADGYAHSTVLYDAGAPDSIAQASSLQRLIGAQTGLTSVGPRGVAGADAVVVVGTDFDGRLHPPPPPPKPEPEKIEVSHTTSLVPRFRELQRKTGMQLLVPTRVANGSRVTDITAYRIGKNNRGPWAVKVVFELPPAAGYKRYWGIMATQMSDPPVLRNPVGKLKKGNGVADLNTYYNGRILIRDAFRYRGVNYWVSNTIDDSKPLNSVTIHSIARGLRPVGKARLPKGVTNTPITIGDDPATP